MYFRVLGLYKININSHHTLILYSNYEMLQSAWDWDDHPDTKKYEEEALARAFSHQVCVLLFLNVLHQMLVEFEKLPDHDLLIESMVKSWLNE